MPVHDAPVHELTKVAGDAPYGCSNAERKAGYWVLTRLYRGEHYELSPQWIEDRGSKLCRYDMRAGDPKCGQCKLATDVEHLATYGL